MNYGEIQSIITSILSRNDPAFTTLIPAWITEIQNRIQQMYPYFADNHIVSDPQTFTPGVATYTMPSDYKSDLLIYVLTAVGGNVFDELEEISIGEALANYATTDTGLPESYVIRGETITFYPTPDQAYTYYYEYENMLPALSASTDSNFITENFPFAIIYGVLSEAFAYLQEDYYMNFYQQLYRMQVKLMKDNDIIKKLGRNPHLNYNFIGQESRSMQSATTYKYL
jgi:hypothetical protein